jgi:hypothetical protein
MQAGWREEAGVFGLQTGSRGVVKAGASNVRFDNLARAHKSCDSLHVQIPDRSHRNPNSVLIEVIDNSNATRERGAVVSVE